MIHIHAAYNGLGFGLRAMFLIDCISAKFAYESKSPDGDKRGHSTHSRHAEGIG